MSFIVPLHTPKVRGLKGHWRPPADKSISHRALLLSSMAVGISQIYNCLDADDVLSTRRALSMLGIKINPRKDHLEILGQGRYAFRPPAGGIDVGNSGTTLRLLTGLLSAQPFSSRLTGDASLLTRPMGRLVEALQKMGARLAATDQRAPIRIHPIEKKLSAIHYEMAEPSAQIKSALLLAGLYAEGETIIREPVQTRDHTERMLRWMEAPIRFHGDGHDRRISIQEGDLLAKRVDVPGDLSSAAFMIALALLMPGSHICIEDVGLNPTRTGFLDIVKSMGGKISYEILSESYPGESIGRVSVEHAMLSSVVVSAGLTTRSIDEIPLVALLATQAEGQTIIEDAAALRFKESDRLKAVAEGLRRMGAVIREIPSGPVPAGLQPAGLVIEGPTPLSGADVSSYGDHRIAMMLVLAGLIAKGQTRIDRMDSIGNSFPNFLNSLNQLATS